MKKSKLLYHGHCFPPTVISCAVRWYFRFQLSLRDIEELLFERGVVGTYETFRCWCDKFGKGFAQLVKATRCKPDSIWHLEEMFVSLRGEPYLLWRGGMSMASSSTSRCKAARQGRRQTLLQSLAALEPGSPQDRHRSVTQLSGPKREIPELAKLKHVFVKAVTRLNNRAKNSHQPTRERERRMRGFRSPKRTQKFLSCFGPIRQHFALKRHLLPAALYRKQLAARFVAWVEFAELTQTSSIAF